MPIRARYSKQNYLIRYSIGLILPAKQHMSEAVSTKISKIAGSDYGKRVCIVVGVADSVGDIDAFLK